LECVAARGGASRTAERGERAGGGDRAPISAPGAFTRRPSPASLEPGTLPRRGRGRGTPEGGSASPVHLFTCSPVHLFTCSSCVALCPSYLARAKFTIGRRRVAAGLLAA